MAALLSTKFRFTPFAHARAFSRALTLSQPSTSKLHFPRDRTSQSQYQDDRPRIPRSTYSNFKGRQHSSRDESDEHERDRPFRTQYQDNRPRAPQSTSLQLKSHKLSSWDKSNEHNTVPKSFPPRGRDRPPPTPHEYRAHRATIKRMYPEGWAPPRTISREAMETLREMNKRDPVHFRVPVLAAKFKISPEAVSRILKSKWQPSPERKARLLARDHLGKDKWIAEKIRAERVEAEKSLEGRWDPTVGRGKDKLTMR